MSLKLASFFAVIGMLLLTVLDAAAFLRDAQGFAHDIVPSRTLLAALIRLLATFAVTLFFFVFHRAQPR